MISPGTTATVNEINIFNLLIDDYRKKKKKAVTFLIPSKPAKSNESDETWNDDTPLAHTLQINSKPLNSTFISNPKKRNWGTLLTNLTNLTIHLNEEKFELGYHNNYVRNIRLKAEDMLNKIDKYQSMITTNPADKDRQLTEAKTAINDFYNSFELPNNKSTALISLVGAVIGAAMGLVVGGIPGSIAGYKAGAAGGAIIGSATCAGLYRFFSKRAHIKPYADNIRNAALDLLPDESDLKSNSLEEYKGFGELKEPYDVGLSTPTIK